MTWQQIVLIVLFGFNIIASILMIGKERKTITPGSAVIIGIIDALLIAMVISIPVEG